MQPSVKVQLAHGRQQRFVQENSGKVGITFTLKSLASNEWKSMLLMSDRINSLETNSNTVSESERVNY